MISLVWENTLKSAAFVPILKQGWGMRASFYLPHRYIGADVSYDEEISPKYR
jgi:hypothetical protein